MCGRCVGTPQRARRNIPVIVNTHARLKEYGKYGDSWDDIVQRLMDFADTHGFQKLQHGSLHKKFTD